MRCTPAPPRALEGYLTKIRITRHRLLDRVHHCDYGNCTHRRQLRVVSLTIALKMPVFSEDFHLPSYEELTVPEVEVTSGVLRAASLYFGKYCDQQSKEFMLCKTEAEGDPRKCINEGKEVTRCGMDFFQKVKANCYEEFTSYWNCIDDSNTMEFKGCRKPQSLFDRCIGEKMDITRPEPGYFSKVRLHTTVRDKPQPKPLDLPEAPSTYSSGKKEPDDKRYPSLGLVK